jgi:hypothetical protein
MTLPVFFYDPPITVGGHPERVFRTLYDARRFVKAMGPDCGHDWEAVDRKMQWAVSIREQEEAGSSFLSWLASCGLPLITIDPSLMEGAEPRLEANQATAIFKTGH